jgi:signal transduction histidine kinase
VSKVQDQSEKLNSLVQDLLDISRMENGGLKVNMQEVDLEEIIHQAMESTLMTNQHRPLHIERTGDAFAKPVLADPLRIEQVLSNYLSNAVKYAPDSDSVIVHSTVDENFLTIEVRDNGIGIPQQKIPYVFDKFFRVQDASARFQGLGLGLHICKEIIAQHGGACGVESKVGQGSTFYFTLPISR